MLASPISIQSFCRHQGIVSRSVGILPLVMSGCTQFNSERIYNVREMYPERKFIVQNSDLTIRHTFRYIQIDLKSRNHLYQPLKYATQV